jgi:hypothetical protein
VLVADLTDDATSTTGSAVARRSAPDRIAPNFDFNTVEPIVALPSAVFRNPEQRFSLRFENAEGTQDLLLVN